MIGKIRHRARIGIGLFLLLLGSLLFSRYQTLSLLGPGENRVSLNPQAVGQTRTGNEIQGTRFQASSKPMRNTDERQRVQPYGTLSGRVIDRETRQPIPSARVWLQDGEEAWITTDEQGLYEMPLASSPYRRLIVAEADGYERTRCGLSSLWARHDRGPTLALPPATAGVSGQVVDTEGRPLTHAKVWLAALDQRYSILGETIADEAGFFGFPYLVSGQEHLLSASTEGYKMKRFELKALPPHFHRGDIKLELSGGYSAWGRAVDAAGNSLSGIAVRLTLAHHDKTLVRTTTGKDGAFQVAPLAYDDLELHFEGNGYAFMHFFRLGTGSKGAALGDIVLPPTAVFEGIVVDEQGQGLEKVGIYFGSGTLEKAKPDGFSAEDGSFAIPGRLRGNNRLIRFSRLGFLPESLRNVEVPTEMPLRVVLKRAFSLSGRVVEQDNRGVEGILVRYTSLNEIWAFENSVATDSDGRFSFPDVEPGPFQVYLEHGTRRAAPVVTTLLPDRNNEPVRLVLEADAILEGYLWTPDGAPAIDAEMSCLIPMAPGSRGKTSSVAISDGDGYFRLEEIPPGEFNLQIRLEPYDPLAVPIRLLPGRNRQDFQFEKEKVKEPGFDVSGTVTLTDGEPLAGVLVDIALDQMETGPDGTFHFQGLPKGAHFLELDHPELLPERSDHRIQVVDGPVTGIVLKMVCPRTIHGVVTGLPERWFHLLRIWIVSVDSANYAKIVVDRENGAYRVEGVSPGTWLLGANVDTKGYSTESRVTLTGEESDVELDLHFEPGHQLTGTVWVQGRGVHGLSALLTGQDCFLTKAVSMDGSFQFEDLRAGNYQLNVRDEWGNLMTSREVPLTADQSIEINIQTGDIEGLVLDERTHAPLQYAIVLLYTNSGPGSASQAPLYRAATDERGRFHFQSVLLGKWQAMVEKSGYRPKYFDLEHNGSAESLKILFAGQESQ